jgi:hypothetical protein
MVTRYGAAPDGQTAYGAVHWSDPMPCGTVPPPWRRRSVAPLGGDINPRPTLHASLPMRTSLLGVSLLLSAVPAAAQRIAVDGRRLTAGTDSLAIFYIQDGDTTRTGLLRDDLTFLEESGRLVLRRVYRTADRGLGARLDTLVDLATTLEPVRHRSRTNRTREVLDFAGGQVRGWLWLANGDSVAVAAPVAPGTVNASAFDLVLRAADLRAGWSADVPAFLPHARATVILRPRVTGLEDVAGEPSWRVEADFTGMPVTFWIGQRSRALHQQVMQLRPDVAILFRRAGPGGHAGRRGRAT